MKYLTQDQVVRLHQALIETSGGSLGIRDEGMLNSALKLHYKLLSVLQIKLLFSYSVFLFA